MGGHTFESVWPTPAQTLNWVLPPWERATLYLRSLAKGPNLESPSIQVLLIGFAAHNYYWFHGLNGVMLPVSVTCVSHLILNYVVYAFSVDDKRHDYACVAKIRQIHDVVPE